VNRVVDVSSALPRNGGSRPCVQGAQAGGPTPVTDSVVVGYDGSAAARRALVRAAAVAGASGHVVVVVAVPPSRPVAFFDEPDEMHPSPSELLDDASVLLASLDVRFSTRIENAEPATALAEIAREVGATLIVVGARGDSFLTHALRGSVGEKLVARAPCDVLIAR
jgi:nucleotide-binding universal stress UspA family protein